MPRDGSATRVKILETAQAMVYERGFAATTLDGLLDRAGLTKGAFFHHFKNKNDMAKALIDRYLDAEIEMLNTLIKRAEQVSKDPLQQVFVLIGFLIDMVRSGGPVSEGCLFASYALELAGFDEPTCAVARKGFFSWRKIIGAKMAEALEKHPPKMPVEAEDLADTMLALFEGAVVISKLDGDPQVIARKLEVFRGYLELLTAHETAAT